MILNELLDEPILKERGIMKNIFRVFRSDCQIKILINFFDYFNI